MQCIAAVGAFNRSGGCANYHRDHQRHRRWGRQYARRASGHRRRRLRQRLRDRAVHDNAFKITPGGVITEIIDATSDGAGNPLDGPWDIAVDGSGNVYVTGFFSDNAFKITSGGVISEIIDATGDGAGNPLNAPRGIAVDGSGNVYVTGWSSDNAFKITPGGVITKFIDATGDGAGNPLNGPWGIAVDGSGNVYVAGLHSDNAFKITPGGVITEIIDATGDGAGNPFEQPFVIAVEGSGNVYVEGYQSDNAFKITPGGVITEIIDATGDGAGNPLDGPRVIAVDGSGNAYVAGISTDNAFKITPGGVITEIIDATGDGAGNPLNGPWGIAVDGSGNVYVAGSSHNAFKIALAGTISGTVSVDGNGLENVLVKLLDYFGLPVDGFDDVYTDANGEYSFTDVPAGNAQVMILEPFGYSMETLDINPKDVVVNSNSTTTVDFNLEEFIASIDPKKKSYWKHQFDKHLKGKPYKAKETEEQLNSYIAAIHQYYTPHFDVFAGKTTFEDWQGILSKPHHSTHYDKALIELGAFVLNFGSLKLPQYYIITEDGRTAGDLLTYVSQLITNPGATEDELKLARKLAKKGNKGKTIEEGIVPAGGILYKGGNSSIDWSFGIPAEYALYNNYPNPFNPSTIIVYQIPERGNVSLKVYDMLGKEVTTLVEEYRDEGRYEINFDASALSSGVYIYQLRVNDYLSIKKMILMK